MNEDQLILIGKVLNDKPDCMTCSSSKLCNDVNGETMCGLIRNQVSNSINDKSNE